MQDLYQLSLAELIEKLEKKQLKCTEVMQQTLQQIKRYDHVIKAFLSVKEESELMQQAAASDQRRQNGQSRSRIEGLPIALKDNIHVMGFKTSCGSRILSNYAPPFNATVSNALQKAGAIIIGKTNMDEFAMGSTCETSALQKTCNPWDTSCVPGGSSGGSAAAVAAKMSLLALGSDTGGSIRQPAAFCGISGLKPTYGLVSRFGLVSYASSLDQIGPLARDVYGLALLLGIIAGHDSKDSTSLEQSHVDYTAHLTRPVEKLKIAVFPELFSQGIDPKIKNNFTGSIARLKEMGACVEEVPFPALKYVISTYYFIATAEASSNLSRYDGVKYGYRSAKQLNYEQMLIHTRSLGLGKEVKKRILLGNFVLSSGYYDEYYRKAQKVRQLIMNDLKKILTQYDAVAMPTTPTTAFKFGQSESDPLSIYLADVTTVLPNLTGLPAVSLPSGLVNCLPAGLQLIGAPLEEAKLLNIAYQFEQRTQFKIEPDFSRINHCGQTSQNNLTVNDGEQSGIRYTKELINNISDTFYHHKSKIKRTLCQDLRQALGKKVTLCGSIYRINNLGGIEFYTLKDRTGMTQLVWEGLENEKEREKIGVQTVVQVTGLVSEEARSQYDQIEIKVEKVSCLGKADADLPINISHNYSHLNLPTMLDYRPLSIRNTRVQKIFKIQSEIIRLFSQYMEKNDFIQIKTPKIISASTEGGANIFELKYFERTAYLAQSPQFYKQMLVGSGFERVFETGPVFRAEKHNTIRHLNEYTSLDFEMAYINSEQDIIDLQEKMLQHILQTLINQHGDILSDWGDLPIIPERIPRIHFLQALEIAFQAGLKDMDGDLSPEAERVVCDYYMERENSPFVYIIGYPVKKRPMYTMPDKRLPGYTRSFDLLYKGLEITTGGQRIHDYQQLRESIIEKGSNPADFKDYLSIFKFGMPPHGGLGMGLERLTMKILNLTNIREASLFPRDTGRLAP